MDITAFGKNIDEKGGNAPKMTLAWAVPELLGIS